VPDELSSDLASLRIDHDLPRERGPWLRIAIYLAIAAGIATVGYFVVYPRVQAKLFKTQVEATEIVLVSPSQSAVDLTSTGYVVPQVVSQAAPKVAGRVAEVKVKQGQDVNAGDTLLVLDSIDQEAAIAAARSRVATAHANAQTARANLAEIEQQLGRERGLAAEGVSAKAVADDLAKRAEALKAAVRAADAAARAAQAEVKSLEVSLKSYTLVSPIAGRILNKAPEIGEFVGPAMPGIASTTGVIEIADFSTLAVETDVPEGRLALVKAGRACEIILDAFPSQRYRGEVYEIVPRVNRAKATVIVKVKFVDDNEGVLPDMSARVSFLSKKIDDTAIKEPPRLVVPSSAVVDRSGAKVVFVLEDGRVRMVPIEVGQEFGDGFELVRGPTSGTRVVKNPAPELSDGQQVKERTDG
jgi:RND family efflux transporter MFP subunit